MIGPGRKVPIQELHYMTGHTGRHLIKPTVQYLVILTTGKSNPCECWPRGKISQPNIPKISEGTPEGKPGERIFIDISSMMYPSAGGKKHWLLIVDEATDYSHSIFMKKKSDVIGVMFLWIKNLGKKHHGYIKKIRLDNSGENRMLQAKLTKKT